MKRSSAKSGKGIDLTGARRVQELPTEGFAVLTHWDAFIVVAMIWPVQCSVALAALLPNEGDDMRHIAVLSMLYRWILKSLRHISFTWDREAAGPWDVAVPGSSAECAAYEEEVD